MSPDFIQPPVLLDPFSAESLKHTNLCNVHLYNDPFCQCNSVHSNVSSLPPGPRAFRIQLHPYSPVSAHLLVKAAVSSSSSFLPFLSFLWVSHFQGQTGTFWNQTFCTDLERKEGWWTEWSLRGTRVSLQNGFLAVCCSVAKLCPAFCSPTDCSTSGSSALH